MYYLSRRAQGRREGGEGRGGEGGCTRSGPFTRVSQRSPRQTVLPPQGVRCWRCEGRTRWRSRLSPSEEKQQKGEMSKGREGEKKRERERKNEHRAQNLRWKHTNTTHKTKHPYITICFTSFENNLTCWFSYSEWLPFHPSLRPVSFTKIHPSMVKLRLE